MVPISTRSPNASACSSNHASALSILAVCPSIQAAERWRLRPTEPVMAATTGSIRKRDR